MKSILLKGLSESQSDEMRQAFSHAVYLRQQMKKILQEKIDSARKQSISKDAYNSPNWAFLQADAVGYERAMQEVISILSAETDEAVAEGVRSASSNIKPEMPRRGRPRKNI